MLSLIDPPAFFLFNKLCYLDCVLWIFGYYIKRVINPIITIRDTHSVIMSRDVTSTLVG